jgi:phage tail sheath gpL-like
MVNFARIPQSGLRTPFAFFEIDASQAGYFVNNQRTIIFAQVRLAVLAGLGVPEIAPFTETASRARYGTSQLSDMIGSYRKNDNFGEVWVVPLLDNPDGVAATGKLAYTGPATAAGVITLRIHDEIVQVGVNVGDTATAIATATAARINATAGMLVTASAVAGDVTITCAHKGTVGNEITLKVNAGGALAGEAMPGGVTCAVTAMANGLGDPSLTPSLDLLGDREYDFIVLPFTDTTSLDAIKVFLDDVTGRWAWNKMLWGCAWSARRGTLGQRVAFGLTRNDPHTTIMGFSPSSRSPAHRWAAAYAAQGAVSIRADCSRPLQTLPLVGIHAGDETDQLVQSERNTLLMSGIATHIVATDGTVLIEREITTYQKNGWGQPDPSFLDIVTLYQLMLFNRFFRQRFTTKFPRHKLASNGFRGGPGQAVVTPDILKVEIISGYRELETMGHVENGDLFAKYLIVERDSQDPNRVNLLLPPDFVNQLRVIAANVQFRLQFPANA